LSFLCGKKPSFWDGSYWLVKYQTYFTINESIARNGAMPLLFGHMFFLEFTLWILSFGAAGNVYSEKDLA
jgi:hypothetical protein